MKYVSFFITFIFLNSPAMELTFDDDPEISIRGLVPVNSQNEKQFICSVCGYIKRKREVCQRHIIKNHNDDPFAYLIIRTRDGEEITPVPNLGVIFSCITCNRSFNWRGDYTDHLRSNKHKRALEGQLQPQN